MVAVHLTVNCTLLFVTGKDDIARFDSRRYTGKKKNFKAHMYKRERRFTDSEPFLLFMTMEELGKQQRGQQRATIFLPLILILAKEATRK